MHKNKFSINNSGYKVITAPSGILSILRTLAIMFIVTIFGFTPHKVNGASPPPTASFNVTTATPQACYREGLEQFNHGRYWKALNIWEETLKVYEGTLTSQQRKGLRMRIAGAYKEINNNPEANTPQAKGTRSYDKACVAFKTALTLTMEKKSDEAIPYFDATYFSLKEAEEFGYMGANHNHMMAFSCLNTERLSAGWTYLDKSIQESPSDPKPLNLKVAYLKKGKQPVKNIIDVLNRSLKIDKNQKEVHLTLAKIYASQKQYQKALDHSQIASEKDLPLARELVKLFPNSHYRDEMQSMITNLAAKESIRIEKERLAKKQELLDRERAEASN
jgi:tetratricopeptide (TPR) repeat protein